MERKDGRSPEDTREIRFERGFSEHAPGSVLASFGRTRVLCTAMCQDGVPPFLQGKGRGWRCHGGCRLAMSRQNGG